MTLKCYVNSTSYQSEKYIRLEKTKNEYNSSWESAFYQNKWAKINSSWFILVFYFMCVAANASALFCMAYLANIERFFMPF